MTKGVTYINRTVTPKITNKPTTHYRYTIHDTTTRYTRRFIRH